MDTEAFRGVPTEPLPLHPRFGISGPRDDIAPVRYPSCDVVEYDRPRPTAAGPQTALDSTHRLATATERLCGKAPNRCP